MESTIILLVVVFLAVGFVSSYLKYTKNNKIREENEGQHVVDFKISSICKGYIANDRLYIKEGFDLGILIMPKILEVDLTKATAVGFYAKKQLDYVRFFGVDGKAFGPVITMQNIKQVQQLYSVIEQYAPHIEIHRQSEN